MATNQNGAFHGALTTRQAFKARLLARPRILPVPIPELDDPTDPDPASRLGKVLILALRKSEKEDYQWRKIADDDFTSDPDEQRAQERQRNRTWGQVLKGNQVSLIARVVVDEAGDPLWSEADVTELADADAKAMERIYAAAVFINGFPFNGVPDWAQEWAKKELGAPAQPPALEADYVTLQKKSANGHGSASSMTLVPTSASGTPTG